MLKNIFAKTLFEKRWTILLWLVVVIVVNFGVSMIFPPIRDMMGTMLGQIPYSMKGWFGDVETWQTFAGYASQEIFGKMSVVMMIMAIIFGASFLAGEESSGVLLSALSKPVNRLSYYLQKYFALVVFILIVMCGFLIGAALGGIALGQPIPLDKFLAANFMVSLHVLALGSISFAIGAITGNKNVAGLVVGFYAFLAYFISSLSTATDIVDKISHVALYRYASATEVMTSGLNASHVWIFVIAIIIPLVIAAPIFSQRDLKTR